MKTFVKPKISDGEAGIYEILNSIAPQYNKSLSTLVLPQALSIDKGSKVLTLPFYEGELFNEKWDESSGGLPLGLDLVKEVPLILKDLSNIDTSSITFSEVLSEIPRVTFDYADSKDHYSGLATKFRDLKLLSDEDYTVIEGILGFKQESKMILNNGDFYPRNFIRRSDGKIVLIDWETWNDNSPFWIVDHPENVAAVQFVHMWGNPAWQKAYWLELQKYLDFPLVSFNKGIVMKALELAQLFHRTNRTRLVRCQIDLLRDVLDT